MAKRPAASGPSAPPTARLKGIDTLKGLCIVGVVLIHAAPRYDDAYGIHVVGGLMRLAVPLFLAVTGYLVGLKRTGRSRFRSNLITFVRLHLIYGAFYGLFEALMNGVPDPLTVKFVVMRFGQGAYLGQYYLVILIQLFLFLSLLPDQRSWRSAGWVWGSAATATAGVLLLAALPTEAHEIDAPVAVWKAARTPYGLWIWFFYFALGARLGSAPGAPTLTRLRLAGAGLGLVVATIGFPDLPAWGDLLRYPYARVPIYLGAMLGILALPALARLRGNRVLARLGRDSFGIFVFNPAALMSIAHFFGRPASVPESWLHAAVALAACSALTTVLRRRARWALP